MSSFFLSYSYNPYLSDGVNLEPLALISYKRNPRETGDVITQKLRQVTKLAQTLMAAAQQRQEDTTN